MPFVPFHQQTILHTCPECGTQYVAHPFKTYCTTRCKQRARTHRVRERETVAATSQAVPADPRVLGYRENVTRETVVALAQVVSHAPLDKFFLLTGTVTGVVNGELFGTAECLRQWDGTWCLRQTVDPEVTTKTRPVNVMAVLGGTLPKSESAGRPEEEIPLTGDARTDDFEIPD